MRVATFNIHHAAPPGGFLTPANISGIAEDIRAISADIIAVQEVDRFNPRSAFVDQAKRLGDELNLHSHFCKTRTIGPGAQYGIALLAKGPIGVLEQFALPAYGGEQRMCIVSRLDIDGFGVSVASTHLHNRRLAAQGQLPVILKRLSRRVGPLLVMGDMNLPPKYCEPIFNDHGFVVAESGPTFASPAPTKQIDWIAGRNIGLSPATVIPTRFSDHCIVSCEAT